MVSMTMSLVPASEIHSAGLWQTRLWPLLGDTMMTGRSRVGRVWPSLYTVTVGQNQVTCAVYKTWLNLPVQHHHQHHHQHPISQQQLELASRISTQLLPPRIYTHSIIRHVWNREQGQGHAPGRQDFAHGGRLQHADLRDHYHYQPSLRC